MIKRLKPAVSRSAHLFARLFLVLACHPAAAVESWFEELKAEASDRDL